jgi:hypothetical protein
VPFATSRRFVTNESGVDQGQNDSQTARLNDELNTSNLGPETVSCFERGRNDATGILCMRTIVSRISAERKVLNEVGELLNEASRTIC